MFPPGAAGAHRVDLVGVLGLARSTVSGHLACLRDCGLVSSAPRGRASLFTPTQPVVGDVFAGLAAREGLGAWRGQHCC